MEQWRRVGSTSGPFLAETCSINEWFHVVLSLIATPTILCYGICEYVASVGSRCVPGLSPQPCNACALHVCSTPSPKPTYRKHFSKPRLRNKTTPFFAPSANRHQAFYNHALALASCFPRHAPRVTDSHATRPPRPKCVILLLHRLVAEGPSRAHRPHTLREDERPRGARARARPRACTHPSTTYVPL